MMKGFLAGIGIGLGLGMLFAPMSGEETRNNLRERANDLADQARDAMQQGKDRVRSGLQAVRGQAQQMAENVGANRPATGTEGNV
jgi:gas vesicle protein